MRILIRVVHDADDRNPVAADLAGDIAVEILRRHHGNLAVDGARGRRRGKGEQGGEHEPGDSRHDGKACMLRTNAGHLRGQYVTL